MTGGGERETSRLGVAAITVAAIVVPLVAALFAAAILGPRDIPAWVKTTLVVGVLVGGLVVGGRASVRAAQRRYPPVEFTGSDLTPALRVVTDTMARLGPRNHVVFGVAAAELPARGSLEALISVRTDRKGRAGDLAVQLPYTGRGDPSAALDEAGIAATGWEVRGWEANEFVILAAPLTASPRELLEVSVTGTARLHDLDPAGQWQLSFVV